MEELLQDEKSKEVLKEFIHQYIAENLRLDLTQYQNGTVDIDVYLGSYLIQSVQSEKD